MKGTLSCSDKAACRTKPRATLCPCTEFSFSPVPTPQCCYRPPPRDPASGPCSRVPAATHVMPRLFMTVTGRKLALFSRGHRAVSRLEMQAESRLCGLLPSPQRVHPFVSAFVSKSCLFPSLYGSSSPNLCYAWSLSSSNFSHSLKALFTFHSVLLLVLFWY